MTLIELMVVVCILGILAGVAMVVHHRSLDRARAVEGEMALREVDRLQLAYMSQHHRYADDLNALGFALSGTLKYHRMAIAASPDPTRLGYVTVAIPLDGAVGKGWVLRRFPDNTTTVDRVPMDTSGRTGAGSDPLAEAMGTSGPPPSSGAKVV